MMIKKKQSENVGAHYIIPRNKKARLKLALTYFVINGFRVYRIR